MIPQATRAVILSFYSAGRQKFLPLLTHEVATRAKVHQDVAKDALENYHPDEIRAACRGYVNGPNRDRKPKTGDIVELIVGKRTEVRRSLPKPPEPPIGRVDPQELEARRRKAEEIMARFRSDRA